MEVAEAARIEDRPTAGAGGFLTVVSWAPPHQLDFAEWARHGRRLGAAGRGSAWWIGDWLAYGETRYGEHYTRAAEISGYEVQSLMNMAYVASRFDFSRRRENLTWSHHAEVAALPIPEQDTWLDRSAETRLSIRALRRELREARATPARALAQEAAEADEEEDVVCPSCGHRFNAT
jgi:hypothetical protein